MIDSRQRGPDRPIDINPIDHGRDGTLTMICESLASGASQNQFPTAAG